MSLNLVFQTKAIEAARLQARYQGHRLSPLHDNAGDPRRLLGHCLDCGMRVEIDHSKRHLCGDALLQPCDHNGLRRIESRAWLISKIPSLMLRRFHEELERLSDEERALFEDGDFQPDNLALVSRDGIWALRYEMRDNPFEPISEDNRQSAEGITFIEREIPATALRWARYTGPRLNPNGHENEEQWLVLPLEPQEIGWTYQDRLGCQRFRREDGVIGYYIGYADFTLEDKPTQQDEVEEEDDESDAPEALFESAEIEAHEPAYP